jgi:hypothetical protein
MKFDELVEICKVYKKGYHAGAVIQLRHGGMKRRRESVTYREIG